MRFRFRYALRMLVMAGLSVHLWSRTTNAFEVSGVQGSKLSTVSCKPLSNGALLKPQLSPRKNVCIRGILSIDREYAVLLPDGVPLDNGLWDVAIFLPNKMISELLKHHDAFDGRRATIRGDVSYNARCWGLDQPKQNEILACAPATRPIYLDRGKLIVAK